MTKQEKLELQLAKEKEKEAKKQAKQKVKKEKPQKIKKEGGAGKIFLAVILWLLLGVIAANGVWALIHREDSASIKRNLDEYYSELSKGQSNSGYISSFAESFVTDYYTNNTELQDGSDVSKYLAAGLPATPPETNSTVVSAKTLRVENEKGKYIVTIRTQVILGEGKKQKVKTLDVCVPIKEEDGNYAVCALPYYSAYANDSEKIEADTISESDDTEEGVKECKSLAKNFLSAYYGTKPSELKYFVTADYGRVVTVGNGIEFETLNACGVEKDGDAFTIECSYVISNSGFEETQEMVLEAVYGDDGKLYVNKITTE